MDQEAKSHSRSSWHGENHLTLRCSGNSWFTNHLSALKQGRSWAKLLLWCGVSWLWELCTSPISWELCSSVWHLTCDICQALLCHQWGAELQFKHKHTNPTTTFCSTTKLVSELLGTLRSSDTTTEPVLCCDDNRWCFTHPSKPVTHLRQVIFWKAELIPLPNKTPASSPGTSLVRDPNEPSEPAMELYQCLKRKCQYPPASI